MKEFIEKLIGRLEEEKQRLRNLKNNCVALSDHEVIAIEEGAYNFCKNIVNELAEEYKDKVMINGQYCWQTCSATEHCKECNRLRNGSIDYYENYDVLAEEYINTLTGWISVKDSLPSDEKEYLVTLREGEVTSAKYDKEEKIWVDTIEEYYEYPVIAWQSLPEPYKEGVAENE